MGERLAQSRSLRALATSRGPHTGPVVPGAGRSGRGGARARGVEAGEGRGEGHRPLSRRGGAGRGGSAGPARGVGRGGPGRVRRSARHSARRAGRRTDLRRAAFGS